MFDHRTKYLYIVQNSFLKVAQAFEFINNRGTESLRFSASLSLRPG